jgi:hypothetical protein
VDLIPVPFPGAGVVWDFAPISRTITSLSGNLTGQDFTAILLGDVSGNWSPSAGAPPSPRGGGSNGPKDPPPAVTLALRTVNTRSNGTEFWLLARAQESPIYSLDLVLSNRLTQGLAGLRSGAFAETMAMTSNTRDSNLVRVGLAGAVPLRGVGALLVLTLPGGQSNEVALVSALIQEGAVPVEVDPTGYSFDADSDGDGQTDWSEIRAGSMATDKRSVFALRAVTLERGGARKISWSAVAGRTYQVLFMPEGVGGEWQLLGAPVNAASQEASVLDEASALGTGRMYRVQLVE